MVGKAQNAVIAFPLVLPGSSPERTLASGWGGWTVIWTPGACCPSILFVSPQACMHLKMAMDELVTPRITATCEVNIAWKRAYLHRRASHALLCSAPLSWMSGAALLSAQLVS